MRRRARCLALAAAFSAAPLAAGLADATQAAAALAKGDDAGVLAACADAAKAGDARCQTYLGMLYSDGKGVARDLDEAEKWYGRAAAGGEPEGALGLGLLIIRRDNDWRRALQWIRPAAARRLPEAETTLALAYENGSGVRKNPRLALRWYGRAAAQGESAGQSRLAGLYERGDGVPRDWQRAYYWHAVALRDPNDPRKADDEAGLKRAAAHLDASELTAARAEAQQFVPRKAGSKE